MGKLEVHIVNWEGEGMLGREKTKEYCIFLNAFFRQIVPGRCRAVNLGTESSTICALSMYR